MSIAEMFSTFLPQGLCSSGEWQIVLVGLEHLTKPPVILSGAKNLAV
jgi:hypothetical protein